MSDETFNQDDMRLQIARDLTSIAEMFIKLKGEAVNRAGDPDIPGGAAMVLLANGADVEAWSYYRMSAMFGRLDMDAETSQEIEKFGIEPPLSFLASWADIVREERGGEPSGRRARIADEIRYLRASLDWMLAVDEDGAPWWLPVEDFATRLAQVRRTMENVLHEGKRDDKINARCNNDHCSHRPRLSVRVGMGHSGEDYWQCPACKQVYDEDGVARCWRTMFVERGDAPEWLPLRRAASAVGRPVSTVRSWTIEHHGRPAVVESKIENGRTQVRWADVRAKDDTSKRRGKTRQIA